MSYLPPWVFPGGTQKKPPQPELSKYDINEEPPLWNWTKIYYGLEPVERDPRRPKQGGVPSDSSSPDWRGVIKDNVIAVKPPPAYKFGNLTPDGYFWFETPDYADPFKKLRYSLVFFTKFGLLATCTYAAICRFDFNMKTHAALFRGPFSRIWMGGMSASLAVIAIANLRGKVDDYWNYAWAGLVAGAVASRGNHWSFVRQSFIWTTSSIFVKFNGETNGKMTFSFDNRVKNLGHHLGSGAAEYGFKSGDFRPSFLKLMPEDPGRMPRTHPSA